tara:strand:+ start:313 stop:420 length:108 start_codon:yes stop_codon:yes gene_type:complete
LERGEKKSEKKGFFREFLFADFFVVVSEKNFPIFS